jgi:hypothetical protein
VIRRSSLLATALAAVAALFLSTAALAPAAPIDRFTPVVAEVLATPEPVLASDGRRHLAYELVLTNRTYPLAKVTVRRVEAIAGGKVIGSLSGKRLAAVMKPFGEMKPGTTLRPGETATVLVDLPFRRGEQLPGKLVHRLVVSQQPASPVSAMSFRAAPTPVSRREAIVVAPPLRGPRWVVGNGCCAAPTSHRAGVLAINGGLYNGERYAIDFFQLTPGGYLADGSHKQLSNYPYFGADVLSATAGRVVEVFDGMPDVPVTLNLPPITIARAGGNHVVVALGNGAFAYYAHLRPGSIRVKEGDRVQVGQVLGLLGSSGNSNAPHLHFQLMDGPIPAGSNGVPYRFSSFTSEGTLTNFVPVFALGAKAQIAPKPTGTRSKELPLDLEVVSFK